MARLAKRSAVTGLVIPQPSVRADEEGRTILECLLLDVSQAMTGICEGADPP